MKKSFKPQWYIADVIEEYRIEGYKRAFVWVNKHLIRANSGQLAYKKAIEIGKISNRKYKNTDNKRVHSIFRGLMNLLPIYEPLEDGAEIQWTDNGQMTEKAIRKLIAPKQRLQALQKTKELKSRT